ncbi:hypothetical protein F4803DRAFT_511948 [Xylaria telfairii]|nr:hypothetical protein F4803DRAFT_511948 [Xylaria telfairii]
MSTAGVSSSHRPQQRAPAPLAPLAPPSLELPFFAPDNETLALKQLFRAASRDYADSIGEPAFTYTVNCGTLKGRYIVGDLECRVARPLLQTVTNLVDQKLHEWQPRPDYAIRYFFIGNRNTSPSPYLVILCNDPKFSYFVRRIIIDSKILSTQENWGCCRLPIEARTLTNADSSLPQNTLDPSTLREYEIFVRGNEPFDMKSPITFEVWRSSAYIGNATIGGLVIVNEQTYALTVAHVFHDFQISKTCGFDIDESEFDGFVWDRQLEDKEGTVVSPPAASKGLITSLSEHFWPGSSVPDKSLRLGYLKFISDLRSDVKKEDVFVGLDWALLELEMTNFRLARMGFEERDSLRFPFDHCGFRNYLKRVTIHTPDKDLEASLTSKSDTDPNGMFGLPIGMSTQPVITVSSSWPIQPGHSGSWVTRPDHSGQIFVRSDPRLLGMVVGASPSIQEVYFLHINWILADIKRQLHFSATVDSVAGALHISRTGSWKGLPLLMPSRHEDESRQDGAASNVGGMKSIVQGSSGRTVIKTRAAPGSSTSGNWSV